MEATPLDRDQATAAGLSLGDRMCLALLPQEVAARQLGITRLRLNDLLQGKLAEFPLDALVNLVTASGLAVHVQVVEAA